MKKFLLIFAAALLLGLPADALAQRRNRDNDRSRIRRGVRSGNLTREEARRLREQERANRAQRRTYRSDGTLTREERRDIRRDERQSDRRIRREVHDDDRRDRRRGNGYYRRGAGSPSHPVFGHRNRHRGRGRGRN
ncbi:MAG: hypothetical protein LC795_08040 [Acidobacteria bacterium]|nr:hypothetical protein [Acidobacteriota bacterium]